MEVLAPCELDVGVGGDSETPMRLWSGCEEVNLSGARAVPETLRIQGRLGYPTPGTVAVSPADHNPAPLHRAGIRAGDRRCSEQSGRPLLVPAQLVFELRRE